MKNLSPFYLLIICFFFACSNVNEAETTESTESEMAGEPTEKVDLQAVLNHHLGAFMANDLDEVLFDYTDESIIMTPDSTYTGLEQIGGLFSSLFPLFPTEGTSIEPDKIEFFDNMAYLVWHGESPSVSVPLGTDTFVFVDGKIHRQTFTGVINPKE